MKELAFITCFLVSFGMALSMPPASLMPNTYFISRVVFWPVMLGITITKHRQTMRDIQSVMKMLASGEFTQ